MVHGDDSGLIFPPKVAPYQVVIVPIPRGNWQETVLPKAREIAGGLMADGIRVRLDDRDVYTPGWKFSEWEMRGVPIRIEIGPRDLEGSQVIMVRRDTREKLVAPMEGLSENVSELLKTIQSELFKRARTFRDDHTTQASCREDFNALFKERPGFVIAPWCGDEKCEASIKTATQATIRNIPLKPLPPSGDCIECGLPAQTDVYFAKSY